MYLAGLSTDVDDKYAGFTDEQVIEKIHNKDEMAQDYIINKYKHLVKTKTREYFLVGGDNEDILQEGMIGLFKAIRDYKSDKLVPFYYFAELCITRQVISAIKAATRQKHIPLNAYISLSKVVHDQDSEKTYLDTIVEKRVQNPEDLLIGREEKSYIESLISQILSEYECRVLYLHLQGKSYQEIAVSLTKDEKSIDNAIQRVRRKLEKFMNERDLAPLKKVARV